MIAHSLLRAFHEQDAIRDNGLWWRVHQPANVARRHPAVKLVGKQTRMGDAELHLAELGEQVAKRALNFFE